jgi:hypothetical protein
VGLIIGGSSGAEFLKKRVLGYAGMMIEMYKKSQPQGWLFWISPG